MRFFSAIIALLSAVAVSATTWNITVGGNDTLTYTPDQIQGAEVGDILAFTFVTRNHTVTQSSFTVPCDALSGGVDSGFNPVAANATSFPQWSFTLNNASAPLWFYCRQTGHCQEGMVFALNPTVNKTFAAFQATAESSNSTNTTTSSGSGSAGPSATGSSPLSGPSASSSSTPSASGTNSGAIKIGGGAGGALAVVGLILGLVL